MPHVKKYTVAAILASVMFSALFVTVEIAETQSVADKQWKYVLRDGGATITGYADKPSDDLVIPSKLDGYAVTGIGDCAFSYYTGITT